MIFKQTLIKTTLLALLFALSACCNGETQELTQTSVETTQIAPDESYTGVASHVPFPSDEDIDQLNREFFQTELNAYSKTEEDKYGRRALILAFDERAFQHLTWFRYDLKGYEVVKAASNWQENYVSPTSQIDLSAYSPSEEFQQFIGALNALFSFRGYQMQVVPYPVHNEEFVKLMVFDDEAFEFAWQMRILNPEITVIEYMQHE